jgi:hypothetical protein
MFDDCVTLEELANKGPMELPELKAALAKVGRSDMVTARRIAVEWMRTGSTKQAVYQAMKFID